MLNNRNGAEAISRSRTLAVGAALLSVAVSNGRAAGKTGVVATATINRSNNHTSAG